VRLWLNKTHSVALGAKCVHLPLLSTNRFVTWFGFDPDEIAKALIEYLNKIDTYGSERHHFHKRGESLLRIRSD
jgi:hypothetical protein